MLDKKDYTRPTQCSSSRTPQGVSSLIMCTHRTARLWVTRSFAGPQAASGDTGYWRLDPDLLSASFAIGACSSFTFPARTIKSSGREAQGASGTRPLTAYVPSLLVQPARPAASVSEPLRRWACPSGSHDPRSHQQQRDHLQEHPDAGAIGGSSEAPSALEGSSDVPTC